MLGIMGAMSEEIDLLKSKMKIYRIEMISKREFIIGHLFGIETVLVFSRYGKVSAATTSTLLKARFNVAAIIFVGVAGSADPTANIGDVVISNQLVQYDMDCTPLFERYEIPLLGKKCFEATPSLVSNAKEAAENYLRSKFRTEVGTHAMIFQISNPKCHVGLIASGDQFIKDQGYATTIKGGVEPLTIEKLLAFEMEGAAVAQTCFECDIPFVVIRTISDNADHGAPINFAEFIVNIARHYSSGIIEELYKLINQKQLLNKFLPGKVTFV